MLFPPSQCLRKGLRSRGYFLRIVVRHTWPLASKGHVGVEKKLHGANEAKKLSIGFKDMEKT